MKVLLILVALLCVVVAHGIREGQRCRHYSAPCGTKKLIKEEVASCPSNRCKGPNVCIKTRTYMRQYYSYTYRRVCRNVWSYWRRRYVQYCNMRCQNTGSCDLTRNSTTKEYHCCTGFTTNTTKHNYRHYWYRESTWYLRKYGCPRKLFNSTLDCLDDLGLTEFSELLSSDLKEILGNSSSTDKYTIFASPNELLLRPRFQVIAEKHIVKRNIRFPMLYDGISKESIRDGHFIHVSAGYIRSNYWSTRNVDYYINGIRLIAPDACLAVNGVVHVIQGVIDSTNMSIAQVVSSTSSFSAMASLLTKANLLSSLNSTHGFLMTLFAPNDTAFRVGSADLKVDIVPCLLSSNNSESLKTFLKYLTVCNAEYSAVLENKTRLLSEYRCPYTRWNWRRYYYGYHRSCRSNCKYIPINVNDDGIQVGQTGSRINKADIPASNGVIHQLNLPLVNPCLNLTKICSNFPLINSGVIIN